MQISFVSFLKWANEKRERERGKGRERMRERDGQRLLQSHAFKDDLSFDCNKSNLQCPQQNRCFYLFILIQLKTKSTQLFSAIDIGLRI